MADETLSVQIVTNAEEASKQLSDVEEHLQRIASDYAKNADAAKAFAGAQQSQSPQVVQNPLPFDEMNDGAKKLRETVTDLTIHVDGLRRTGSALVSVGATEQGILVSKIAALQQVYRQLGSLTEQIPLVGEATKTLTPLLGASAAEFLVTAAAVGALVGVVAIAGVALKAYTDTVAAETKAVNDAVKAAKDYTDTQLALIDATQNATKAQVEAQIATDKLKLAEVQTEKANRQAILADIQKQYADLSNTVDLNPIHAAAQRAALGMAGQAAQQAIDDSVKRENDLTTAIKNNTDVVLPAAEANDKLASSSKDAIAAIQSRAQLETKVQNEITTMTKDQVQARLAAIANDKKSTEESIAALAALPSKTQEARDALTDLRNHFSELNIESGKLNASITILPAELKKASDALVKVVVDLKTESDKYTATLAERVQADARATAQEALETQISNDKQAEAAAEGRDKLAVIHQSETDLEIEEANKRKDAIAQINEQFLQNSAKLWTSYYNTEMRDEAAYGTERLRKLQDLNTQLLNYVGTRDIASFVNTRQSGLTQISRSDQDETTAERQRREDYERQANEQEKAREDQITQLEVSLTQETDTKRAALQKQEQDQIAANNAKVKLSEQDAKKLSDLQATWAKNDRDAKRLAEDMAHAATMAKLQKDQTELSGIIGGALQPAIDFFSKVSTAISDMFIAVKNAAAGPVAASYSGGFGAGQGLGAGITRAIDNRSSSNINNTPINVTIGTWGAVVSEAQMDAQIGELVKAIRVAHGAPS